MTNAIDLREQRRKITAKQQQQQQQERERERESE
jgi:hypothetical protein